jgi:hypothetical protein
LLRGAVKGFSLIVGQANLELAKHPFAADWLSCHMMMPFINDGSAGEESCHDRIDRTMLS